MTHRGSFQPLPFCDSVRSSSKAWHERQRPEHPALPSCSPKTSRTRVPPRPTRRLPAPPNSLFTALSKINVACWGFFFSSFFFFSLLLFLRSKLGSFLTHVRLTNFQLHCRHRRGASTAHGAHAELPRLPLAAGKGSGNILLYYSYCYYYYIF